MATQTTNFNLTKPEVNDYVDASVLANNFDLIDTAIFEAGNNPELEGNVAGLVEKIGTTTDVGGSNTAGSVMGKLNKAIDENAALKEYIQKELHPDVNCYSSGNIKHTLINTEININYTSSRVIAQFTAEYDGSVQIICSLDASVSYLNFGASEKQTSIAYSDFESAMLGFGGGYYGTTILFSVNVKKGKTYYIHAVVKDSASPSKLKKCDIGYDTYESNFSPIRSMQSGFTKANKSVVDVTINPVNTSKCIVLVFPAYNGANDSATSAVYSNFTGTSIRVQGGYTSGYTWVNWTIIEFY